MPPSAVRRPARNALVRPAPPPGSELEAIAVPATPEHSGPSRHLHAVPALAASTSGAPAEAGSDDTIPAPPAQLIQKLALYAFEALEGDRAIAQLGGWITPEVVQQLRERRAVRTERRNVYRDERRIVATPGRAHIGRPLPHIVEATVVLYAQPRSCAVALRFEHIAGRWRTTDLTVL